MDYKVTAIAPEGRLQRVNLNWFNTALLLGMHLAGSIAFFFRPRILDISLFVVLHCLTAMGVTIGFHRLLAHRSFQCPSWVMRFWVFWGTASLQGSPIWWVGIHRKHHQATDQDEDPHSPVAGFLHSHFGWFCKNLNYAKYTVTARDLVSDPVLVWLESPLGAFLPWLIVMVICLAIGGWRAMVWGGILRTLSVWHATWCVNSVCHIWGSRPYKTHDHSGNVWWVALWAMGEGWHNTHHAYPKAAFHRGRWWEIDLSGWVILGLQKLRLARNVTSIIPKNYDSMK